jgi:hypothetical protein
MPRAYTEDRLVEQTAIGQFAELGWQHRRSRDLVLTRLLSGQVDLKTI